MNKDGLNPAAEPLWAYAYAITPPQPVDRLVGLQQLLDREHASATEKGRKWKGSLVMEEQAAQILVVTDRPDQDSEINDRLEAELRKLKARFAITAPMAVDEDEPPPHAEEGTD